MRNFRFFVLCIVCCITGNLMADDYTLYADEISVTKGTKTSVLNVYMTNVQTISAIQFDIYLPDGVDVYYGENEDEDMVYFIKKGDRAKTDHTASYNKLGDRIFRVMVSSPTNVFFKETDANRSKPIACLTLDVSNAAACGALDIMIKGKALSHYDVDNGTTPYYPSDSKSPIFVRPASGIESGSTNGVASVASAEGTKVSKDTYQTFVNSLSDLTAVDLRAAELGSDITSASDLKPANLSKNAIVMLPKSSTITGENIVVGNQCESLKITDGIAFAAPTNFTATSATYTRELTADYGTICLPYAPSTDKYNFFELGAASAGKLNFTKVDAPKADTPYLYAKKGSNGAITGSNVSISTGGVGTAEVGEWQMKGTFQKEVMTDNVYFLSGSTLYRNTGNLTINPFRAYFVYTSAGVKSVEIYVDDTPTGIVLLENGELMEKDAHRYNLSGQVVDESYKGVVIVNGKKMMNK